MDIKKQQREKYLELRKSFDEKKKEIADKLLFENLISSKEYIECEAILTFITMGFEVDTIQLINHALKNGKTVYAPFVTKEKRVMKFYKMDSFDDLTTNKFGILEPKEIGEWENTEKSLCIVPALAYDNRGYRIGYGGGFYDYFLGRNKIDTIGIVYDDFIIEDVATDQYDQKVKKIVTDKRVIEL